MNGNTNTPFTYKEWRRFIKISDEEHTERQAPGQFITRQTKRIWSRLPPLYFRHDIITELQKNPVATNLKHDEIYALINEHDAQPIYGRYQDRQNNFIRQWLDALGTPHDTYDEDTFSNYKPYTVAWWRPYREQQEADTREKDSRIRGPNATIFSQKRRMDHKWRTSYT